MTKRPAVSRSYYVHELLAWALIAVALGVLEGGVIGVLLKRLLTGTVDPRTLNYGVAILIGAPHFCQLISFLWTKLAGRFGAVRLLFWVQVATAVCLLAVAAAPPDARGFPIMVTGAVVARLFWSGVVTLRAPIWRVTYPTGLRAQLTGAFFAVHSVVMAATGWAVSSLFDWRMSVYPWVYVAAGASGVLGALVYRGLHARTIAPDPDDLRSSVRAGLRILRDDRDFSRYLFWLSAIHSGNLMVLGPLIAIMSDRMRLAQNQQVLVASSIPLLLTPLAIPVWARLFDRQSVTRFQAVNGLSFALAISVLGVGVAIGRSEWLWAGAALLGVAYAGGAVGWHLGHNRFAPHGRSLQYMATHVTLSGVRGVAAPIAGIAIYETFETLSPGSGGWALTAPLLLCVVGAIGFLRTSAAERA